MIISKPSCNTKDANSILHLFPALSTVMQMYSPTTTTYPWKPHNLFSLEFEVEKLLQNINKICPKVLLASTAPLNPRFAKRSQKKKKQHDNSQLLKRANVHSAFKLNKLLSHKALRPVQEFKLCCREIVPMSMWLINPSERIRGTFPEELYYGLTRLFPSSNF